MNWLFVDGSNNLFKQSKVLKLLNKLSFPKISFVCLIISITCLWYELFFSEIGLGFVQDYNFGVVFLVFALIFCDKKRIISTKAILYLLLFVLSLLISSLVASIVGLEIGMIMIGIMLFCQFVMAFVISSTFQSKRLLVDVILLVSVPLLLTGLIQSFGGEATSKLWVSTAENLVTVRSFGFFGSPNILGSLSMITIIVALFSFLEKKKWYYLAYLVLSLPVLVLTFSRSAWFGLLIGVLLALLIKNWKVILLAPFSLLVLLIPSVRQRVFVAASQDYLVDAAIDGRVWSFNTAMEVSRSAPVFGTGPGSYGGQTAIYYNSPVYLRGLQNGYVALPYTDNQWLQIFIQTGVVGFVFVIGFFVSHIVNNFKQYQKTKSYLSLGVIAATVAVIINGLMANIWEFGAISVLAGSYLGLGSSYEK